MSKFTLLFPRRRGFSVNQSFYRATYTRTRECRAWGEEIIKDLMTPLNKAIIDANRPQVMAAFAITVRLTFYIPYEKFYTKAGKIAKTSLDLTNVEKNLVDLLFHTKYNTVNLNKDDVNIVSIVSRKVPSNDFKIKVEVAPISEKHFNRLISRS